MVFRDSYHNLASPVRVKQNLFNRCTAASSSALPDVRNRCAVVTHAWMGYTDDVL